MNRLLEILERTPVATVIVLALAIFGGIDLLDGALSPDFKRYADEVGIAAGLLGIGRGIQRAGSRKPTIPVPTPDIDDPATTVR